MRSLENIKKDQERLSHQMEATMNSRTMSGADIRITLEGFAIQKNKLDKELEDVERIRAIEVKEAVVVSDQPRECQTNTQKI